MNLKDMPKEIQKQFMMKLFEEANITGKSLFDILNEKNMNNVKSKDQCMEIKSTVGVGMSFISSFVVVDGIVMAADSACSMLKMMDVDNTKNGNYEQAMQNVLNGSMTRNKNNVIGSQVVSKSIEKLWEMKKCPIAISSGHEKITRNTGKSINPYLEQFINTHSYDTPQDAAIGLMLHIQKVDPTIGAIFHVCGYNHSGDVPYPEFYVVNVATQEVSCGAMGGVGGFNFHGANDYFSQYVPMINENLIHFTLQDAIDITLFAFEMSIKLQRFIKLEEYISPPIDLLVIRQGGIQWIQRKTLRGDL